MDATFAEFWDSATHREFVEALSIDKLDALRDLMLVAALLDELFTLEERVEIAYALHGLKGVEPLEDFSNAEAVDHVDALYDRYHNEGDVLLQELIARLGDALDLSHALEAVIVLMATNDQELQEANFARRLGVLMDVPDDFVESVLQRYGWEDITP